MKFVKKSISLPKELFEFAEKSAEKQAKARGGEPNLSAYLRELLAEQKRLSETGRSMAKAA